MNFNSGWHVLYVRANHEQKVANLLQLQQLESFTSKIKKSENIKVVKE